MQIAQWSHTSHPGAFASSWQSGVGLQGLRAEVCQRLSAPDAARMEAGFPSPAQWRMEEFRSPVAGGFRASGRAKRKEVRAKRLPKHYSLREKLVILRLSWSQSQSSSS